MASIDPGNCCPRCGYETDAATAADGTVGQGPDEGDISICLACSRISIYHLTINGTLVTLAPTPEEARRAKQTPGVIEAITVVHHNIINNPDWPTRPGLREA